MDAFRLIRKTAIGGITKLQRKIGDFIPPVSIDLITMTKLPRARENQGRTVWRFKNFDKRGPIKRKRGIMTRLRRMLFEEENPSNKSLDKKAKRIRNPKMKEVVIINRCRLNFSADSRLSSFSL